MFTLVSSADCIWESASISIALFSCAPPLSSDCTEGPHVHPGVWCVIIAAALFYVHTAHAY